MKVVEEGIALDYGEACHIAEALIVSQEPEHHVWGKRMREMARIYWGRYP